MARQMKLGTKAGLITTALLVQGVVLSAGWLLTFRVVQREFGRVIQERTIDQTQEYAERIASLIPEDVTRMPEYGTPGWRALNEIIKLEAFRELPDGGFACIIEADGQMLCHPEIEENPSIRNYTFRDKDLLSGLGPDARGESILTVGGETAAGGVVEFAADNFHYVATKPLPGSELRLLVHQPADALIQVGERNTRWVMGVAGLAVVGVLGVTGVGLGWLLRRYDGVHEALNRQLKQNLLVARAIQEKTLPADLPRPDGLDIAGWSRPAEETGGDTFDVVAVPDADGMACRLDGSEAPRRIAFLLADATGHGIGPALAVTQLHSMSRLASRVGLSLVDTARLINGRLHESLPSGRFVTAVLGTADAGTGAVELFSAGQGPLLAYRAGTGGAAGTVETIPTNTFPLGVMDDLGSDEPTGLALGHGDVLCLVSDGIIEAAGASGEQFGAERLSELLIRLGDDSAEAIAHEIGEAVETFTGGAEPDDDRTVLILKRDT